MHPVRRKSGSGSFRRPPAPWRRSVQALRPARRSAGNCPGLRRGRNVSCVRRLGREIRASSPTGAVSPPDKARPHRCFPRARVRGRLPRPEKHNSPRERTTRASSCRICFLRTARPSFRASAAARQARRAGARALAGSRVGAPDRPAQAPHRAAQQAVRPLRPAAAARNESVLPKSRSAPRVPALPPMYIRRRSRSRAKSRGRRDSDSTAAGTRA